MRRMHLFEWEDQPWLPRVFRDFITDHLRYTHNERMRAPVNRAIAERLAALLTETGCRQIVDLCAGAGGPLSEIGRILVDDLGMPVDIVLTDLYPNVAAFKRIEAESSGRVTPLYRPVRATDVPTELTGVRTLFTAIHHFKPPQVRAILGDAVRKRAPIAVFEFLERTPRLITLIGLMSFLRGFTHTHIVGRLTPSRFALTYLCPLAPAVFAWDGAVSALRTYTAGELLELGSSAGSDDYRWEAGRFDVDGPFGPMPTTYLVGKPAR